MTTPASVQPSRRDRANALRFLAIDAVEAAKSGHPGMPMGMADIAEVLWNDYLQHNPNNPKWFNRDRFVLSNGHGSMLQYALLHLSGYDLSLDELKHFRQLGSKTPGHPENFETPGVETTTGPLGQGFANAVGMALAEKLLAQRFNRPELAIVDHRTWVFMGDGCLMEGISHEAASLAGTWGLHKLVAFWDDNHISIDGNTDGWFTDDTPARFEAYGWNVVRGVDGQDAASIKAGIEQALASNDKPTLICCRTTIGFGSPAKAGKESSHGSPLGKDEIVATRAALGWTADAFEIPQPIAQAWRATDRGAARESQWQQAFDAYAAAFPQEAAELSRRIHGALPAGFVDAADAYIAKLQAEGPMVASRKASQMAIETFAPLLPELIGGSADLAHSNLTLWKGSKTVASDDPNANYIYFGVREFAMSAICNGLELHSGFIPYDATFLVFSDYARNAVRMSALMGAHVIHVYTHDSIGLGEDGPTHQPVEHLAALRAIPNHMVMRPADATEVAECWQIALETQKTPSTLALTRQNLPALRIEFSEENLCRYGAYEMAGADGDAAVTIFASGSEVEIALGARAALQAHGHPTRVVSVPCFELFEQQSAGYKEAMIGDAPLKIAIEAGVRQGWDRFIGADGIFVGMTGFGASGPYEALYKHFGITAEAAAAAAEARLHRR
jgi:transketolase